MKAMNDKLRNTISILMMLLLPVLFGAAQAGAVDYKNSYHSSQTTVQHSFTAANTTFQSTSPYSGQWREQEPRLVNEDGSVNHEAYMAGSVGPRRSGTGSGNNPGTPDDDEEEQGEQQPLGDGVWILTALACAYLIIRAARKRKLEP